MMRLTLIILFLASSSALADVPQKVVPPENMVHDGDKVDKLLTSNSLRALSGSTSKWSISSVWNYNGGSLVSAFSQDRPNIAGASATTAKTDADASLSAKYNFDTTHSLLAGFGLRYISPFNATPGADYTGKRFDLLNPCLIYQYVYDFLGAQALLQTKVLQWTQTDQTANGYAQQYSVDQETMYPFGKSGLSLALSTIAVINTFNKNDASLASVQSRYQIQVAPYAEYKLSEVYNLKTTLNLFFYENYRTNTRWARDTVVQYVGVGIAFTRDIFLYPNLSFIPLNFSPTRTNAGVQLTLNLF